MLLTALATLAALADARPQGEIPDRMGGDGTLIRFGCSQVVIDRIDPLVNPGISPSPHMHQVVGGNAFNITIPLTDVAGVASCTTCRFAEDLSNYWTANMYFKARNGTYKRVPQIPNRFLEGSRGGMTVYYVSTGKNVVTAFKPGFRMLMGDAARRTKVGSGFKEQNCFRCFSDPNFGGDDKSPCFDADLDFETLPPRPCPGGIRSNIHFPTCWDGKTLDTPNHQDHVAYPVTGPASFATAGDCPASHPVKIPQLMLEIVWDTSAFNDPDVWPEDGSQPFYLSTGDNTGYGQHGDYVFGWKGDALQRAMDGGCFGERCSTLEAQSYDIANQCAVSRKVDEDVEGWLTQLPGDPSGI